MRRLETASPVEMSPMTTALFSGVGVGGGLG